MKKTTLLCFSLLGCGCLANPLCATNTTITPQDEQAIKEEVESGNDENVKTLIFTTQLSGDTKKAKVFKEIFETYKKAREDNEVGHPLGRQDGTMDAGSDHEEDEYGLRQENGTIYADRDDDDDWVLV